MGRYGKVGMLVDVYNLLGFRSVNVGTDPGGTWRPSAENSGEGTYTPDYWYGKISSVSGVRTFKFSLRYTF